MSPMREDLNLSWDDPNEIEMIKKFLKFHAKRLKCREDEVLLKMAKELDRGVLVEVAKADAQIIPSRRKAKEEPEEQ